VEALEHFLGRVERRAARHGAQASIGGK